ARRWHQRYAGALPELQRQYLGAVFALADRARRRRHLLLGGAFAVMAALVAAAAVALVLIRDAQRSAAEQAIAARRAEASVRAQARGYAGLGRQAGVRAASRRAATGARRREQESKELALQNEAAARQAEEEAHLTVQRLQEQLAAMSTRIVDLESLTTTMI